MLFDGIHRKLQRALARKKAEMAEIINVIADSHDAREKVGVAGLAGGGWAAGRGWFWVATGGCGLSCRSVLCQAG